MFFNVCRDLEEALEMGMDWSLREGIKMFSDTLVYLNTSQLQVLLPCTILGYAWAEDKEHCEENGRMLQADPTKVSQRAKKRGLPQVCVISKLSYSTRSLCVG